ncbi:NAD(P)H dehydrogenase (quinone) [Bacilli bacterium PM5-3]|nr:NAD(P)H dehydrogenase (quinone) [Bacilli bacterium PM5-3]MDH6604135.1 NAD(P)H dehydrogenase (quinone) [Bacilli bacterium PM5-9]
MKTIVITHPYENSFNMAILNEVTTYFKKENIEYNIIDLYQDNFDPVLRKNDLAIYGEGKSNDPLVKKYNEILDNTDHIIFIFPIWWYDMPAMLRGFFDKVMLINSSYTSDGVNLTPSRKINKTSIFTTSAASNKQLIEDFGDPINKVIINGTFKALGFLNASWFNMELIVNSTLEDRKKFLNEIKNNL